MTSDKELHEWQPAASLSIDERNALLARAWELGRARDYPGLVGLLSPVPKEQLFIEPELGYWLAAGWKYLGRWSGALELVRDLEEPCRRRSNTWVYLARMTLEGAVSFHLGRLAEAEALFLRVIDVARGTGEDESFMYATMNLGTICDVRCQWQEALANYRLAMAVCQRLGDRSNLGLIHHNLAMTCRQLALFHEASSHFEKALIHMQAAGGSEPIGFVEMERAHLLYLIGDLRLAEATARRALHRFADLDHSPGKGDCLRVLGIIAAGQGRRDEAKRYLTDALGKVRAGGYRLAEAEVLEEMAVLEKQQGNDEAVPALADAACAIYEEMGAVLRAQKVRLRVADPS